ncbi:MAG: aminotransferase class V-fold PLP-dependent enzyme [Acidobacteriota bacterium]|nr:aminotransferase class V-fold PLP-dependent enzyme [Acidobacteriota bacterium]
MSGPTYLDHAATAFPKAPGVAAAMARFLEQEAGNPGRGGHRLSLAAARRIESVRAAAARFFGCATERLFFGPGATYWLNALLTAWLPRGGRVLVSALEHNAVMRPLRHLERRRALDVEVLAGGEGGALDPETVQQGCRARPTDLVVIAHASNVSGLVQPVEEIARRIAPVPLVVDGAQTAGSRPFTFDDSGVAAFVASAHKGLLGPPGLGLLLLGEDRALGPFLRGGTGSRSESEDMPDLWPDALEPGTPNTAGIAGLGAALDWFEEQGGDEPGRRTRELAADMRTRLARIPGVRLHGLRPGDDAVAIVSFTVDGEDNGELAAWLDREQGLALRAGLHCAPAAHRCLGTFPAGTLRASPGPLATSADCERLVEALEIRTREKGR